MDDRLGEVDHPCPTPVTTVNGLSMNGAGREGHRGWRLDLSPSDDPFITTTESGVSTIAEPSPPNLADCPHPDYGHVTNVDASITPG